MQVESSLLNIETPTTNRKLLGRAVLLLLLSNSSSTAAAGQRRHFPSGLLQIRSSDQQQKAKKQKQLLPACLMASRRRISGLNLMLSLDDNESRMVWACHPNHLVRPLPSCTLATTKELRSTRWTAEETTWVGHAHCSPEWLVTQSDGKRWGKAETHVAQNTTNAGGTSAPSSDSPQAKVSSDGEQLHSHTYR
jgi:hypothetical protein